MQELRDLKEQYRKGTAEVVAYAVRVRRIMYLQLAVLLAGAVGFTGSLIVLKEFAEKNEDAIEVGCTLLRNAILETGQGDAGATTAQQRRTAIYLRAVQRILTSAERAELARLPEGGATRLTIPNCRRIAKDPESVLQP